MNQETGWGVAHILCLLACIKFTSQGLRPVSYLTMNFVFVDYEDSVAYIFIAISLDSLQSKYVIDKYLRCNKINIWYRKSHCHFL